LRDGIIPNVKTKESITCDENEQISRIQNKKYLEVVYLVLGTHFSRQKPLAVGGGQCFFVFLMVLYV
jgi:hypothetical protein